MPFPVAKLGYLVLKQLSKPLARAIKDKARTSNILRNYILLPPAQIYHSFETNIKMKLLGFGKTKEVKPLNEEMGVELAAEMLGEMFIFSIAAGTIYFEYKRQQWKEQDKENVQNSRLAELEEVVLSMESQMEKQNTKIKHLNEIMLASVPKKKLPDRIVDKKSSAILHVEKT